ncbi:Uncharacterised protein [Streptococcus canis]|nr:Uncharacterised protein [Streptococcus canis]
MNRKSAELFFLGKTESLDAQILGMEFRKNRCRPLYLS